MSSRLALVKQFVESKDKDLLALILSDSSEYVCNLLWFECLRDVDALEILLKQDFNDVTLNNYELLQYAINYPSALKLLLEDRRIDPAVCESRCLIDAAEWNQMSVKLLLQDGRADPGEHDSECLRVAAEWSDESVKLLLEDGRADPTACESECLRIAAKHDSDCLRLILEDQRADPGAKSSLCIGISAEHNPESFILLLQDGRAVEAIQHREMLNRQAVE